MRTINLLVFTILFFASSLAQTDDGRTLIIPVIFHVIYVDTLPDNGMSDAVKKGDDGNSTTRLPKEKIQTELDELDKDFLLLNDISKVNPEHKQAIGNPKIHFTIKKIIYVKADRSSIQQRTNYDKLHELSPMENQDTCLNVYISILRVSGGGSEGVTNVPTNTLPTSDAVNLNYSWVGLGYHLLSHEVGHWLGLWHVFDVSQINISNVTDIPVQTDQTDKNCVNCIKPKVKVIKEQRSKFKTPNTNNYMDYSGCRSMFSTQQCSYMRNIIIKFRPGMWNNPLATKNNK